MNKKLLSAISGLLAITIPLSLIIWYIFLYNSNRSAITPLRVFHCLFTTSLLAIYALNRKSVGNYLINNNLKFFFLIVLSNLKLDITGAIAGLICAIIFMLSNYAFAICLLILFLSGSKATKFRGNIKNKFEEDYENSR